MKRVYDNCCGIDVHKKLIVACLIRGQEQDIKEFGATTRELLRLADWLARSSCEMVAMESTGSYWKPLYNVLESSGFGVMVVNARHIKTVPGRKTDAGDAFQDLGADYDSQLNKERKLSAYLKKLKALGYELPSAMEGCPA